jgi:hypothetical protein
LEAIAIAAGDLFRNHCHCEAEAEEGREEGGGMGIGFICKDKEIECPAIASSPAPPATASQQPFHSRLSATGEQHSTAQHSTAQHSTAQQRKEEEQSRGEVRTGQEAEGGGGKDGVNLCEGCQGKVCVHQLSSLSSSLQQLQWGQEQEQELSWQRRKRKRKHQQSLTPGSWRASCFGLSAIRREGRGGRGRGGGMRGRLVREGGELDLIFQESAVTLQRGSSRDDSRGSSKSLRVRIIEHLHGICSRSLSRMMMLMLLLLSLLLLPSSFCSSSCP